MPFHTAMERLLNFASPSGSAAGGRAGRRLVAKAGRGAGAPLLAPQVPLREATPDERAQGAPPIAEDAAVLINTDDPSIPPQISRVPRGQMHVTFPGETRPIDQQPRRVLVRPGQPVSTGLPVVIIPRNTVETPTHLGEQQFTPMRDPRAFPPGTPGLVPNPTLQELLTGRMDEPTPLGRRIRNTVSRLLTPASETVRRRIARHQAELERRRIFPTTAPQTVEVPPEIETFPVETDPRAIRRHLREVERAQRRMAREDREASPTASRRREQ